MVPLFYEAKKVCLLQEVIEKGKAWHKAVYGYNGKRREGRSQKDWGIQKNWGWGGNYAKWSVCIKQKDMISSVQTLSASLVGSSVNLTLLTVDLNGSGFYLQVISGAECQLIVDVTYTQKSPAGAAGHLTYIFIICSTQLRAKAHSCFNEQSENILPEQLHKQMYYSIF